MSLRIFLSFLILMLATMAFADGEEKEETPSAANPAALAVMPAVWHPRPVTQMSMATKLQPTGEDDAAIAVAISQQLNDRILVRGAISHALQKDQTVVAATLIVKW